jgi:two-component system cell cycle sensor histidine kinase/response regulator CckA
MKDQYKTKKQLIEELEVLRNQLAEPKKTDANHKRAGEALLESEETFKALAENANDGILVAIGEGIQAYANKRASEITGYSVAELLKSTIKDLVHPDEFEKIMGKYRKRLAGEPIPHQDETVIIRKDGKSLPIELTAAKTVWKGQPAALVIIRDITERKQTEVALKESEQRFRTIFEGAIDGILLADIETKKFHTANKIICEMLGYSLKEIKNLGVVDIHPKEALPFVMEQFDKLVRGEITKTTELPVKRKDGSVFYAEISTVLLKVDAGTYLMGTFRDVTERKQTEEVLRESEERYRRIVDNSLMGIGISRGNKVVFANPALLRLFGYDDFEEFTKIPLLNHVAPASHELIAARMEKVAQGEPLPAEFEYDILCKDGRIKTLLASSQHFTLGGATYAQTTFQDITERKQMETALRESEERFRAVIESQIDLISRYLPDTTLTFVNDAYCQFYGKTREELIGHSFLSMVAPEFHELVLKETENLAKNPRSIEGEYLNYRQDGEECWIQWVVQGIGGKNGRVVELQAVGRDITERKRTEEALRESEERFRLAFENANTGVCLVDLEGNLTKVNDKMCEIFGYTKEELERMTVNDIAHPEDIDKSPAFIQRTLRGETDRGTFEKRYLHKKGHVVTCQISSSLVRNADGSPLCFISHVHDITERKRAEEESEVLREQLRQSQKMEAIGRLAGGVAHDFNNLLTIIKGYSQLSLIELKEDSPLKKNIEHIHEATDRAANLVRQLLAFSRRQILEMKVLDLNAILTNLDNMLRRVIGEDIELITVLAEDLGRVKTDPGWIEQAIMNLVVNSRDAMPSGGKLTIETGNADLDEASTYGHFDVEPGRYAMLSVSDTGVGITPEVMERLFEPFFSTKEKDKGTGLGLSMAYGIVKQCGGDIWVYGEPGKGATFKIYLPRVDEPLEERREKVLGDEFLRGSETILLVEDEENVRKLTLRILERQGYKVLSARDGDDALLICEQFKDPIHLMLTDVVMPRMSGHELAKHLKSSHPKMKVLYMSGYTDNTIVLHGVLMEGVDFIQKPFTVDALTKKIREVLKQ